MALAYSVLLIASLASSAQNQERKTSLTGNIVHIRGFESKFLGNRRDLIVYLPPDYTKRPDRHYPVLYMHDGQNVMDGATSFIPNLEWRVDETAEGLIQAGLIEPLIIVGIDNAGLDRGNEYLPIKITLDNGQTMGGKADLYGKMITDEIMPKIENDYRVKRGPKNTGLAGSSLGGVISLYLGLTRPEKFGKLAVISPSIWVGDRYLVRKVNGMKSKTSSKIWLDMGSAESETATDEAQQLDRALLNKGWKSGKDLAYFEDGGAIHNEQAWARRFGAILMFLFGKR